MSSRLQTRGMTTVAMLALAVGGGLAMAQQPPSPSTAPSTAPSTPSVQSASELSKADTTFLRKAAEGGLAEVQLGQLAQQQGASDEVKAFGQRMIMDHQAANQKLLTIATAMNEQLPTTLSKHDQNELTKLQSLHGAAFDRAYVKDMRSDHRKDIREFEHEARHGKATELKQFADSTLPTLKDHLAAAEKLPTSSREASASHSNQPGTYPR